jgi:hypothetical protein
MIWTSLFGLAVLGEDRAFVTCFLHFTEFKHEFRGGCNIFCNIPQQLPRGQHLFAARMSEITHW